MNWNFILNFIIEYWRELASCICLIISVVFYVIKRKPLVNLMDSIKEDVLELLPELINKVECDGNGQRKKDAVISMVVKYVQKKYQVKTPNDFLIWLNESLESILSTPQKKGY